ncbi:MAG: hypothetical protein EBU84_12650, partial [Actinobacteria bacterium]|nr:hypothetical protein [Actinomycetota bacterium]
MNKSDFTKTAAYEKQLAASKKEPHELVLTDFVNWRKIDVIRQDYVSRGLSVPVEFQTDWDTQPAILGSYRWETEEFPSRDLWLARLEEVLVNDILIDPSHAYDLEWDEASHGRRVSDSITLVESLGDLLHTIAYRDAAGRLISKNDSFLVLALKELGRTTVPCWVIETEGGYALNRAKHYRAALSQGLHIPAQVSQEYTAGGFKLSTPLLCPTYTAKDLAR